MNIQQKGQQIFVIWSGAWGDGVKPSSGRV